MSKETYLILAILFFAMLGNNRPVAIAAAVLVTLKLLNASRAIGLVETYSFELGMVIFTLAVLVPLASGSLSLEAVISSIKGPLGLVTVAAGVAAAYLAGRGADSLLARPEMMPGIIFGSLVAVALLRGIAVGPLIAAGFVAVLARLTGLIKL